MHKLMSFAKFTGRFIATDIQYVSRLKECLVHSKRYSVCMGVNVGQPAMLKQSNRMYYSAAGLLQLLGGSGGG
jgi:hypothetical protein